MTLNFKLEQAIEILERTPPALEALLSGLSEEWIACNEGEGTWNAAEVVEHLIEGERTNWMPRMEWMVREGASKPFPPFDRYAHLAEGANTSMEQKLARFKETRADNMAKLKALSLSEADLEATGTHPAFGEVKLRELLSTWVAHDLTHLSQIVRVMAERYRTDVGPWIAYLGILKNPRVNREGNE